MKWTQQEKFNALRLIRSENVGPMTYHQMLGFFKTPSQALEALPDIIKRSAGGRKVRLASKSDIDREIAMLEKRGGKFLFHGESDYPRNLAAIPDAPPVLAALGNAHLASAAKIGFVGARNGSAAAVKITSKLAGGIGEKDFTTISGMARGVDTAAHWASIATGTVAVLAGGVDVIYPTENTELYERLCAEGLILSETPLGTKPLPRHFPRRNRLISGMSLGVVIVEAAFRSGSLITARLAGEQGREVMAVPGSPLDPRCSGTNNLIKQGAAMVETVDDILHIIRPLKDHLKEDEDAPMQIEMDYTPESVDDAVRQNVIELLGPTPTSIDDLIAMSGLTPQIVHIVIMELELSGKLYRDQMGMSLKSED